MKKKQKKQLSSNFFQNKINNKLITLRLKKHFPKLFAIWLQQHL